MSKMILFGLLLGLSVGGNFFLASKFLSTKAQLKEYGEANHRLLQAFDFYGSIQSIDTKAGVVVIATNYFTLFDAVSTRVTSRTFLSEQTVDSKNQIVSDLDDRTMVLEELRVGDRVRVLARDTGEEIVALWIRKIE